LYVYCDVLLWFGVRKRRGMPKETFTDPNPEFDIEVESFEELADELC